jgi:uncharacterized protein (TIGR03083 family)
MPFAELDTFAEECDALEGSLAAVPGDAWDRAALGSWTLAQLGGHILGAATRVDGLIGVAAPAAGPDVDRVSYYRYDAADVPARDEAPADPTRLAGRFAEGWRAAAGKAGTQSPDRLLATWRGAIRLDEYMATRVLEMVVHHMDLRAALDLPPASAIAAERMTMRLLEGLLGAPRPRNLGRDRFIRAATGRTGVDDPRFPVLR